MKNTFFWLAILLSFGLVACEKSYDGDFSDCSVFVNITPGEETILLASSGLPYKKHTIDLLSAFEVEYGKENVVWEHRDPHRPKKNSTPICYELTLTVDVDESARDLPTCFMAVKRDGRTRIYKFYEWACTDKQAYGLVPRMIDLYEDEGDGVIISTDIKKLGLEVHDMPIVF